jgi:hypothetical protein
MIQDLKMPNGRLFRLFVWSVNIFSKINYLVNFYELLLGQMAFWTILLK